MEKITRMKLIAEILEMYTKLDKGYYKEPVIRYSEKHLKRLPKAKLQLIMAEMLNI